MEGDESRTTVEVKGNPKPTVIWKHNDKVIIPTARIRLINQERVDSNNDTIVTSVLHIEKLLDEDTGLVQVIGKYGDLDTRSPETNAKMRLDVQCESYLVQLVVI